MLALIAGWAEIAFPGDYGNVNTYFWIPLVGPLVGGSIGAYLYDWLIWGVLIARGATSDPEVAETSGADSLDEPGGGADAGAETSFSPMNRTTVFGRAARRSPQPENSKMRVAAAGRSHGRPLRDGGWFERETESVVIL